MNEVYTVIVENGANPEMFVVILQRAWHRATDLFLRWVLYSAERPLGAVRHIWGRHEFQTNVGSFSPLHCLIWTTEDVGNPTLPSFVSDCKVALSRITASIRGTFQSFVDPEATERLAWDL